MITVGLIKELNFISMALKMTVDITFNLKYKLNIHIKDNVMNLHYNEKHIWRENVADDSMFGIESCDAISRILSSINAGNNNFIEYIYFETT